MTAPFARTICGYHDEHVDPDTGHCDACQRDARLDCPACDGEVIYTRHPALNRPVLPVDGWLARAWAAHPQPQEGT